MNGMVNYGILQPNVGNALAAGYQQAEDRRNALMQQQQQRQLGDIQLQNALREQRMAEEEGAAYKAAGSDMTRLQSELAGRGLGKQAMAVASQLSKQQAEKLAMLKTSTELMKQAATSIMANPTLETALGTLQSFAQRTGADVSNDIALVQSLGNDPAKIRQWAAGHAMDADKLLPKFQQFDQGGAVITGAVDPLTGQFRQGTAYQKSMAPGEAERIAISRGQLGVAQAQLDLARQKERRVAEQGESVEISPKEIQKREAAFPKATSAVKGFENEADKLIRTLQELRDHPGLDRITGLVGSKTWNLSDDARRAQALYDNVVAKGQFQTLQDLRNSSPTGGALGSVSDKENQTLRAAFAAINQDQSTADIKNTINQVIEDVKGSKQRIRDTYDMTYEYKGRRGGTAAPAPAPAQPGVIDFGSLR